MRKYLVLLTTVLTTCSMLVAVDTTTAAASSPDCTFTPHVRKRITVGRDVTGFKTPLGITGRSDCGSNFDATTNLVHGRDSYFLLWDKKGQPDSQSAYAFEIVPGTYHTTGATCDASSANFEKDYTCSVRPATTIIKFAGRPQLQVIRQSRRAATFIIRTERWSKDDRYIGQPANVEVQRKVGQNWHSIHALRTSKTGRAQWSSAQYKRSTFRVVESPTSKAFAGVSAHVTK